MRSFFRFPTWMLLGLLLAVTRVDAAILYVQGTWASGTAASRVVGYPSAQSAGALNVVIVTIPATASISSVTDSAGDTYALAGTTTANGGTQAVYYAQNVAAAGTNTVTATFTSSTFAVVTILQYSGVNTVTALDGFNAASGTGTAALSGSANATTGNSLVVGAISFAAGTATVGSGFTSRVNGTGSGGTLAEDRIVSGAGPYAASATGSTSTTWLAQVVVFRAAASGDSQAPTTPSALSLIAASSNEIDLAWNASTDNVGVTGYILERCQGAGCSSWSAVATPTATNFNDSSRTPSTSYSYRASARDAAGNTSAPSAVITYVTPASSPDCN